MVAAGFTTKVPCGRVPGGAEVTVAPEASVIVSEVVFIAFQLRVAPGVACPAPQGAPPGTIEIGVTAKSTLGAGGRAVIVSVLVAVVPSAAMAVAVNVVVWLIAIAVPGGGFCSGS